MVEVHLHLEIHDFLEDGHWGYVVFNEQLAKVLFFLLQFEELGFNLIGRLLNGRDLVLKGCQKVQMEVVPPLFNIRFFKFELSVFF